MSDAMQIARQRRGEYEESIARKEREIEELREMIGDLDRFLEFGQDLIGGNGSTGKPADPAPAKPNVQNIQDVSPKPVNDMDEEWDTDATKSIENVLAARKA